jgi:hypothetical protein
MAWCSCVYVVCRVKSVAELDAELSKQFSELLLTGFAVFLKEQAENRRMIWDTGHIDGPHRAGWQHVVRVPRVALPYFIKLTLWNK